MKSSRSTRRSSLRYSWVAWCAYLLAPAGSFGLTPESPEVKAAVANGLKFLEANYMNEGRPGALSLAGIAFAKSNAPPNHVVIQAAVRKIREAMDAKDGEFEGPEQIYNMGLSLIFLATEDANTHRREIDALLKRLLDRQKPNGGWGYPNTETGDTSMTQYGVLALWETYRVGANPPLNSWERVCNWLLRTQDPSGAFGYQGTIATGPALVEQQEVRPSLAAAGLGSLYICGDHFGLGTNRSANDKKVPSALKEVKKPESREKRRPTTVDMQRLRTATQMGNTWFGKNFSANPDQWAHYYYYAYERYESFRETVDQISEKEPAWYNAIGSHLLKTQAANGSWNSQGGEVPDTAFAILFLIRGTKKSIQQALGAGTLVGGRGLPTDASNLEMRLGNVVRKPLTGPAEQLLSVMEDPSNPEFLAAVDGLAETKLEPDDAQLPQQLVRLRKLAGGNSPQARAVALRLLAKTRNLDHVPLLIFALSDSDLGVVKEARDALRFISRKFETLGPDIPEGTYQVDEFERARRKAIEQWKAWYLTVRPDHHFQD